MKNKILIFTATYNEADNIVALLESIDKLKLNIDTLIIDDNSSEKNSYKFRSIWKVTIHRWCGLLAEFLEPLAEVWFFGNCLFIK